MTIIKANYKGKYFNLTCDGCKEEQKTTGHIVNYTEYKRMFKSITDTQEITTTSTTASSSITQYVGEIR